MRRNQPTRMAVKRIGGTWQVKSSGPYKLSLAKKMIKAETRQIRYWNRPRQGSFHPVGGIFRLLQDYSSPLRKRPQLLSSSLWTRPQKKSWKGIKTFHSRIFHRLRRCKLKMSFSKYLKKRKKRNKNQQRNNCQPAVTRRREPIEKAKTFIHEKTRTRSQSEVPECRPKTTGP